MQVVHHRVTDLAVFAVDMADLLFDVIAQHAVAVHPLAARSRQLNQNGIVAFGPAFGEQLRERFEADFDALGVVESVHAQQDFARVA